MNKNISRAVSLFLALILLFGAMSSWTIAADEPVIESIVLPTGGTDGLSPDMAAREVVLTRSGSAVDPDAADDGENIVSSIEEAALYLRDELKNRENNISVIIEDFEYVQSIGLEIMNMAIAHTGVPDEGDYIRFHMSGYSANYSYVYLDSGYGLQINYTISPGMYTTYEEEQTVTAALNTVMAGLNLEGKTDIEKIRTIYDYVCAHVTYDYASLESGTGKKQYTAYAALINGTAVCQGYSNLIYRMMLMAGIDCRIISGIGNGGNHAWNIVKVGNQYYNIDVTWDAELAQNGSDYRYYLLGSAAFDESHFRDTIYTDDAFTTAYPVPYRDYYDEPLPTVDPPEDCAGFNAFSVNGTAYSEEDFTAQNVLYVYGRSSDPNTNNLAKYLNDHASAVSDAGLRVVVILINTTSKSQSDAGFASFSAAYPNLTVLRAQLNDNSHFANLTSCGWSGGSAYLPMTFLKNEEDKLLHYSIGPVNYSPVYLEKLDNLLHPDEGPIPGDLTGDGNVDIYDVVLLLQHSIYPAMYPITYDGSIDFTQDGDVNIYDVVLLLQYSIFPDKYSLYGDGQ